MPEPWQRGAQAKVHTFGERRHQEEPSHGHMNVEASILATGGQRDSGKPVAGTSRVRTGGT